MLLPPLRTGAGAVAFVFLGIRHIYHAGWTYGGLRREGKRIGSVSFGYGGQSIWSRGLVKKDVERVR